MLPTTTRNQHRNPVEKRATGKVDLTWSRTVPLSSSGMRHWRGPRTKKPRVKRGFFVDPSLDPERQF